MSTEPVVTGSGESLTVTPRSAGSRTSVSIVLSLFVVSGSVWFPATVAVFETDPGVDGVATVIVASAVSSRASPPNAHVTTPDDCEQPGALTKVTSGGSVSVTVTPVASSGPKFETLSVYVSCELVGAGSGSAVLKILRSAPGATTVVSSDAVLSEGFGSLSEAVTLAVFVICPVTLGAVTAIWTVASSNSGIDPRLHVIVDAGGRHVPWLGVTVTGVTPVGRGSVTVTLVAASGPLLKTSSVYVNELPVDTGSNESVLKIWRSAVARARPGTTKLDPNCTDGRCSTPRLAWRPDDAWAVGAPAAANSKASETAMTPPYRMRPEEPPTAVLAANWQLAAGFYNLFTRTTRGPQRTTDLQGVPRRTTWPSFRPPSFLRGRSGLHSQFGSPTCRSWPRSGRTLPTTCFDGRGEAG